MKEIKNRIIKTELVDWKSLVPLQNPSLKEMSKDSFNRLKASLVNNNFIQPMVCWQNGKKTYCLDGIHRMKVLEALQKEGVTVPQKLPAVFIKCADRKEAVHLVLVYSSLFARITTDGLYEFMELENLSLDDIKMDVELPEIDFDKFEKEFFETEEPKDAPPQIDKAKELNKKWQVKTGDLWQIGKHRLLCGDSTKAEYVARVMGGGEGGLAFDRSTIWYRHRPWREDRWSETIWKRSSGREGIS